MIELAITHQETVRSWRLVGDWLAITYLSTNSIQGSGNRGEVELQALLTKLEVLV